MGQVVTHIFVRRFNYLTIKVTSATLFVNNMRNFKRKTNRNTSSSLQDNLRAAAAVAIIEKRDQKGSSKTMMFAM